MIVCDLFNKIIDNSNVKHSIFKREYSNEFTTLAAEEFVLCNKFTKSFMEIDLKEYLINNCIRGNLFDNNFMGFSP